MPKSESLTEATLYCWNIPTVVVQAFSEIAVKVHWTVVAKDDLWIADTLQADMAQNIWAVCMPEGNQDACAHIPKDQQLLLLDAGHTFSVSGADISSDAHVSSGARVFLPMRAAQFIAALQRIRATQHVFGVGALAGFVLVMQNKLLYRHDQLSTAIQLTDRELDLVRYLFHLPDGATREDILQMVWGYGVGIETQTLETHVSRLRAKLAPIGLDLHWQQNRYRLQPVVDSKMLT